MTPREKRERHELLKRRTLGEIGLMHRPFRNDEMHRRVSATTRGERQVVDLFIAKLARRGMLRAVWRRDRYLGLEVVL